MCVWFLFYDADEKNCICLACKEQVPAAFFFIRGNRRVEVIAPETVREGILRLRSHVDDTCMCIHVRGLQRVHGSLNKGCCFQQLLRRQLKAP